MVKDKGKRRASVALPKMVVKNFAFDLPAAIAMFEKLDVDQSGCLDASEFAYGMSKFGVHEDKARRIFQEIDADDTGTLTLEELAAVAQQVMSARVDNKKQENKCVNTSKGIAEYLLSFLWRSLPDLAAETREADELTAAVHRKRRTDGEEPPILQTPIASRSTIVPPTTNRFPISHATAPAAAPEFELVGPSPAPSPPEPGTYEEEGSNKSALGRVLANSSRSTAKDEDSSSAPPEPPPRFSRTALSALEDSVALADARADVAKHYSPYSEYEVDEDQRATETTWESETPKHEKTAPSGKWERGLKPPSPPASPPDDGAPAEAPQKKRYSWQLSTTDDGSASSSTLDPSPGNRPGSITSPKELSISIEAPPARRSVQRQKTVRDAAVRLNASIPTEESEAVTAMSKIRQMTRAANRNTATPQQQTLNEHLQSSEVRLIEAVEESVVRTKRLANAIRQVRLATLHLRAANREEARKSGRALQQHYTLTDMLWKSVQGSLVRQLPFATRESWFEFVPNQYVKTQNRIACWICGFMLVWLICVTTAWMIQEPFPNTLGTTQIINGTERCIRGAGIGAGLDQELDISFMSYDEDGGNGKGDGGKGDGKGKGGGDDGPVDLSYDIANMTSDIIIRAINETCPSFGRRPLHLYMCDAAGLGRPSIVAHSVFTIFVLIGALCVFFLGIINNVFWLGIPYGYLHPTQALLPFFAIILRTVIVLRSYGLDSEGRREMLAERARMRHSAGVGGVFDPVADALADQERSSWERVIDRVDQSACVTTAVGLNLSYFLLFTLFVASDLWKHPSPHLKIILVMFLAIYIFIEIQGRGDQTGRPILWEQVRERATQHTAAHAPYHKQF